mmetsp:Transcript_16440/g.34345  ORF Transcript_16440/g.34345 Transcript_16440/m.34345 type:complete len:81 (+) Transcript_16440:113-355(+)
MTRCTARCDLVQIDFLEDFKIRSCFHRPGDRNPLLGDSYARHFGALIACVGGGNGICLPSWKRSGLHCAETEGCITGLLR